MIRNHVDEQTRAIALLCEAIRFETIHRALLRKGIQKEQWQYSWATLALNWSNITDRQFNIPVLHQAVCAYIQNQTTEQTRDAFMRSINKYLGEDRCRF